MYRTYAVQKNTTSGLPALYGLLWLGGKAVYGLRDLVILGVIAGVVILYLIFR